jgi:RNA polymerase sigma factor (sigma-70 family)
MFRGRLYGRGFPRRFIEESGEDLFAEGQLEVIRLMAQGMVIYSPRGLLVHCAWLRTQKRLDRQARAPDYVGLEVVTETADEQPPPDEQVISGDRECRVLEAIGLLLPDERKLIELVYYGGMSCRAAGRALGLSKSTAHRRHQAALSRLRTLLERDGFDP